ncbi:Glycine betaine ABC transport system, ATP-binding protein OpuAA [Staphylococcus gallinarum]|uniref:Glycine betaine ABC transport system, ATP-binding protein OpuAA n=1 Tax=Staphylococcus gallinarum TaxID=1293 RepID=A0A380FF12_STAGA|nr:Glycine betaine ABC transport system, ATP-binding protein OpuAA [Staphylococcus gallinarum]
MTIKENIAQVPQMKKWKEQDIETRIDELLNMVGLDPTVYKERKPDEIIWWATTTCWGSKGALLQIHPLYSWMSHLVH